MFLHILSKAGGCVILGFTTEINGYGLIQGHTIGGSLVKGKTMLQSA